MKASENYTVQRAKNGDPIFRLPHSDVFPDVEPVGGKPIIMEEYALAVMLMNSIVFITTIENDGEMITEMIVFCNDVFYWGCADAEPLCGDKDIEELYKLCFEADGTELPWGSMAWVCLKRKMRPQNGFEKMMKNADVWSQELEALPERETGIGNPEMDI